MGTSGAQNEAHVLDCKTKATTDFVTRDTLEVDVGALKIYYFPLGSVSHKMSTVSLFFFVYWC